MSCKPTVRSVYGSPVVGSGTTIADPEDRLGRAIGFSPLVGAYLFAAVFFLVAAANVAWRLRRDPLVVAGGLRPAAEPRSSLSIQLRRSLRAVAAARGPRWAWPRWSGHRRR